MGAARPPRCWMKGQRVTVWRTAWEMAGVDEWKGSRLDWKVVPEGRKTGSCGRAMMRWRRVGRWILWRGVSSIRMVGWGVPGEEGRGSRRRRRRRIVEDFPLGWVVLVWTLF